ncbi:MAG TPA: protoheme IX farnesyltransferase [Dehalococcoidia bacterium]|jgi:protoheme IX farnesyltransferase|nr:protoheme IX farnesyltransferase [Chloroflexota bacterium]MDP5877860.1 heme o synthase [Dehalococcoidia bacterium]MDP7212289.1 heme o synthase [Dehalococcoidia bacterium]HCV28703.1 protoheme IX farnesyltransferase [Dehalococcoidia bacterium]|tara:strand:- start:69 stop:935 length:867 start_codon:yes stop_codon:yes gene_type:complete
MTAVLRDYVSLTKPRVMSLLLLTSVTGMVLAAEGFPDRVVLLAVLVGGMAASGGASALNHWLDRDIDQEMKRTATRPVASGRIRPRSAFTFGVILNVISFVVLVTWANLLAALLAMAGTLVYIVIYTIWLKRSSVQNIVIGGAAGAIPPMVGWASVENSIGLEAWYLFAIIFFWTPPHFWALALLIKDEYRAAGIPMLPVVAPRSTTNLSIMLYTVLLVVLTLVFVVATDRLGPIYLIPTAVLGLVYLGLTARLFWDDTRPVILGLYKYSLLYLALLFVVVMVDGTIG